MVWDPNRTTGMALRFPFPPEVGGRNLFLSVAGSRNCQYGPVGARSSSKLLAPSSQLIRLPLAPQEYRLSAMLGVLVFVYERQRGA
jgi:hypothetical protein